MPFQQVIRDMSEDSRDKEVLIPDPALSEPKKITGKSVVVLFAMVAIVIGLIALLAFHASPKPETPEELMTCIAEISSSARFLTPADGDAYNDARLGLNSLTDMSYPNVILTVKTVYDLTAAVTCAIDRNVYISVMNGGHSFEGFGTSTPSYGNSEKVIRLLIHMDLFSDVVSFDSNEGTITVQSGMRLGRLYGNGTCNLS
jgi:hypothetical protein